jgi:predicted ATPase/DNA-binding CsgD family transcriptional regulator
MLRSTASTQTRGLPRELTSFVGRRRDLRELKEALSSTSLLTLIGPAGVGKTRLALHAGADLRRAVPDGVCVVQLADLRDPALLAETVASALGLRDASTRWLVSTLGDFLGTKRLFLILDNCEHLIDACAVLADGLLRACPDLKILCTSREPLSIDGETVIQVPPLPLPEEGRAPPADALLQYDAAALFVERARSAWPQFELTDSNAAEVGALCRRLDGLPLALELAAVRLRAFTVGQILEQMDERFRLLSGGSRTRSARHQSLRAAIDWSFGLLSEGEQVAWRRLSIFAGSFDLEGADAVCGHDGVTGSTVGDLVSGLVEKSIVRRELHGSTPRYRMLETLRDYGRERLREAGEESSIAKTYRHWYVDFAARVFEQSWGPSQVRWWDRAHLELANLREIFRSYLAESNQADEGLQTAANLAYYWLSRGSISEGRRWLDALLAAARRPTRGRAMALAVDGWLTQLQGDPAKGLDLFVEGERVAADVGDRVSLCLASLALGTGLMYGGDLEGAERTLRRCIDLQRDLPDRRWAAAAVGALGGVSGIRGDHPPAFDLYQRSIELCRAGGDRFIQSWMVQGQALEAGAMEDWTRAGDIWAEGLRLSRAVDNKVGLGQAVEGLAWVAASSGRPERAARLLGGVHTLREAIPATLQPHLVPYHDRCVAQARSALGDREFDRCYRDGTRMRTEQLVSLALEEKEPEARRASGKRPSGKLTPREGEIAGLVAQGLSNREIASKLVVSQRTAETHVEHILTKLGFTSRSQIAAWVAEEEARARASAPAQ